MTAVYRWKKGGLRGSGGGIQGPVKFICTAHFSYKVGSEGETPLEVGTEGETPLEASSEGKAPLEVGSEAKAPQEAGGKWSVLKVGGIFNGKGV